MSNGFSSGSDNNLGLPISFGFSTNTKNNNTDDDKTLIRGIAMPTNDFNDNSSRSGINNVPSMGVSCRTNDIPLTPYNFDDKFNKKGKMGESEMSLIYCKHFNNQAIVIADGRSSCNVGSNFYIESDNYVKLCSFGKYLIGHINTNQFPYGDCNKLFTFEEICKVFDELGYFECDLHDTIIHLRDYLTCNNLDTVFVLWTYVSGILEMIEISKNIECKVYFIGKDQIGYRTIGNEFAQKCIQHIYNPSKDDFLMSGIEEFKAVSNMMNSCKVFSLVGNPFTAYKLTKDEISKIDIS